MPHSVDVYTSNAPPLDPMHRDLWLSLLLLLLLLLANVAAMNNVW